jgi:hypothetical protein
MENLNIGNRKQKNVIKRLFCAAVSTQTLFTFLHHPKCHSAPIRALVKTQQSPTFQTTPATKTWTYAFNNLKGLNKTEKNCNLQIANCK